MSLPDKYNSLALQAIISLSMSLYTMFLPAEKLGLFSLSFC
ncbi:hypothetical protein PROVRETT_09180 [Providencia rettgeri DSM 1131]|nr:hypothetical protein PROVRETT_09180 [Providencia rettgeri DSM 1131]